MAEMLWLISVFLSVTCTAASGIQTLSSNMETRPTHPVGGSEGSYWSDEKTYTENGQITQMEINSGDSIDGFRVKYGTKWGSWHGGRGGSKTTFNINSDIVSVTGVQFTKAQFSYNRIISMQFRTSEVTHFGPFGDPHGKGSKYVAKPTLNGCYLAFLSGYTRELYNALMVTEITFYWTCEVGTKPSKLIGGYVGSSWSDEQVFFESGYITKMEIRSGDSIDGFRVKYGDTWGSWHGGKGGTRTSFDISNIRFVEGVQYSRPEFPYNRVVSIEFKTGYGDRLGPFGNPRGRGSSYLAHLSGCKLAFMSGYTRTLWRSSVISGLMFHWVCDSPH